MTELDFDELDKAVNSLMGDKVPAPTSNEAPSSVPVSSTPPPVSPTPVTSPVEPLTPSKPPISRPTPPAARRGGRFMDVVPTAPRKDPSSPVSRQGVTLQPSSSSIEPDHLKSAPAVSTESSQSPTPSTPSGASATSDWPDPLELAASKSSDTKSEPVEASASVDLPKSTPSFIDEETLSTSEDVSVEEPLSSPFLPDAKVEKRPLGGAAITSTGSELMVEDENAQLPALPKDVEPTLPEELHGDIVSIAADNSTTDPSKHLTHEPETEMPAKKETEPAKKPAVTVTEAITPAGPTSIPQQYKEEPSSGDQKNGAIYDTDSYHQPLSHPAKKKSGWGWVLWILVILIVGAGGGAALYFLRIF